MGLAQTRLDRTALHCTAFHRIILDGGGQDSLSILYSKIVSHIARKLEFWSALLLQKCSSSSSSGGSNSTRRERAFATVTLGQRELYQDYIQRPRHHIYSYYIYLCLSAPLALEKQLTPCYAVLCCPVLSYTAVVNETLFQARLLTAYTPLDITHAQIQRKRIEYSCTLPRRRSVQVVNCGNA